MGNSNTMLWTILFLVAAPHAQTVLALDSLIGFSQGKSFFQWVTGDGEGARKTQENFLRTSPGFSQVTSLHYHLKGDDEEASKVQMEFVAGLEDTVTATPVLGYGAAAIAATCGDTERATKYTKACTKSTVVAAAAVAVGVTGGAAAPLLAGVPTVMAVSAATDIAVAEIDSAVTGKPREGIIGTVAKIHQDRMEGKPIAGDIYDVVTGGLLEAVGAASTIKTAATAKGQYLKKKALDKAEANTPRATPAARKNLEKFVKSVENSPVDMKCGTVIARASGVTPNGAEVSAIGHCGSGRGNIFRRLKKQVTEAQKEMRDLFREHGPSWITQNDMIDHRTRVGDVATHKLAVERLQDAGANRRAITQAKRLLRVAENALDEHEMRIFRLNEEVARAGWFPTKEECVKRLKLIREGVVEQEMDRIMRCGEGIAAYEVIGALKADNLEGAPRLEMAAIEVRRGEIRAKERCEVCAGHDLGADLAPALRGVVLNPEKVNIPLAAHACVAPFITAGEHPKPDYDSSSGS